jgi:DnaJ like chaperone protein
MQIWGKVFGFLFGFMVGRIPGALLGLWLGHLFDRGLGSDFSKFGPTQDDVTRQAIFFYSTFSVMGHIAKASGRVTQADIAFAQEYMGKLNLTDEVKSQAQEAYREGKMVGFPLVKRLKEFKRSCYGRHDILLMFLEIQIQAAFADGDLHSEERNILHTIASTFGFSARDLDKLLDMIVAGAEFHQQQANHAPSKNQLSNAYRVLGVSEQASNKDVKKSYRKLMSQHHPDKLVAKGLPPEMMDMAKQKAQDIQAAYELINKHRSGK